MEERGKRLVLRTEPAVIIRRGPTQPLVAASDRANAHRG